MSTGRKFGAFIIVLTMAVGAWFYAAPYIIVNQMKTAIKANDAAAVSDHVNFPALRESLKGSFAAAMGKEVVKEPDDPIGAAGAALATAFIGPMVDALVTPEAIAAMLQGKKPSPGKGEPQFHTLNIDAQQLAMGYETLGRFVVKTKSKDNPEEDISFVFTREGFTWKLSAVRLPL